MGSASLPAGAAQGRPDRRDEPVGASLVTSFILGRPHGEITEEPQQAGAVLGGADLQTYRLPGSPGVRRVDPGREQSVHVHHWTAFANLQHQRAGGDAGATALVERTSAEVRDVGVELGRHRRDL